MQDRVRLEYAWWILERRALTMIRYTSTKWKEPAAHAALRTLCRVEKFLVGARDWRGLANWRRFSLMHSVLVYNVQRLMQDYHLLQSDLPWTLEQAYDNVVSLCSIRCPKYSIMLASTPCTAAAFATNLISFGGLVACFRDL